MTTEPNRVDAGVPTGGQFATKIKSDNVPSLGAPARRPQLEGWPENLPEPEVSFSVGDDGGITTTVSIEGECIIEAWHDDDDVHDTDSTVFESTWLEDQDTVEAAEQWARGRHSEIARELRTEMQAAAERARARVLAKATGVTPQLSDERLGELVQLNQAASSAAHRDSELAATAIIARGVLKDYPEASYIGLSVSTADNGDYVSGAMVYNAAHEEIGGYDADGLHLEGAAQEHHGSDFWKYLSDLEPQPENAWWSAYKMPGFDPGDAYTINLEKAARWTPGAA